MRRFVVEKMFPAWRPGECHYPAAYLSIPTRDLWADVELPGDLVKLWFDGRDFESLRLLPWL
jgi:hypothetical protein